MITVIFACVHNAGRSQMAAAWLETLADPAKERALSAGRNPGLPDVLESMREVGFDLAGRTPQLLTDALAREASWLVTMGCGDACPIAPGVRRMEWPLEDPKGRPIERVRQIRDQIRAEVRPP